MSCWICSRRAGERSLAGERRLHGDIRSEATSTEVGSPREEEAWPKELARELLQIQ